jgi:hypothetical protein
VANESRLRDGRAVLPWRCQVSDEAVPVQILTAEPNYNGNGKFGVVLSLCVLAGTPAGLLLPAFWSRAYCRMLARSFGFSAPWGDYPFEDMRQFTGMRFTVLLEPRYSSQSPGFRTIVQRDDKLLPSSFQQWNRKLLKARTRKDDPCLFSYPYPQVPCHKCIAGEDVCELATHPHTYVQRFCHNCEQQAWFDPGLSHTQLCLSCYMKSLQEAN